MYVYTSSSSAPTHTHTHTHTCVCVCVCKYAYIYIHTYLHTYITYIYIHNIYIHIHNTWVLYVLYACRQHVYIMIYKKKNDQQIRKHVLYTAKAAPHLAQPDWGNLVPRQLRSQVYEWIFLFTTLASTYCCRSYMCVSIRPSVLAICVSAFI
jgi:hypothetical protein